MNVFIVLDVNLEVIEDIAVPAVFANKDDAFRFALDSIIKVNGKDIKIHNYEMEGYPTVTTRITNNNSLGSDLGITYRSNYGSYSCTRMILERRLNQA